MAAINSIKYTSDYSSIIIDSTSGTLTIKVWQSLDQNDYISLDPITVGDGVKTIHVSELTRDGSPFFTSGLTDGIYSFELFDGSNTTTQVRLFARDVKNMIYKLLAKVDVNVLDIRPIVVRDIFQSYIVYKGLIYNAVVGQERRTLNTLTALQNKCQSLGKLF